GDSTFIHSGIQPLIDAVYNQIPTHVIILDNRITAMTGHQVNPVTGLNIKGEEAPILDLEKVCLAIGIREVDTVDPWNLEEITKALNKHKKLNEPSVIISKGPCALIPFYQASAPYQVDTDKCTLCKACIRTGCPAISVENDKSHIDINSCTGCGVCFQVCKFEAIHQVKENE
ncbi:MAG TPA: 4Fe-4S dicluster domain-containing protein, partial [Spirochaetales bacterium]|nr:4Fe-4S dicluster domain-containing protein [Spirochaetales bacterium]